jgi:hypothetical protein
MVIGSFARAVVNTSKFTSLEFLILIKFNPLFLH